MFRRRPTETPPEWRARYDRARDLIVSQRPPSWIESELSELERALVATDADRTRVGAALDHLDADGAARDLKQALRAVDPSPAHQQLVASLRERYESIHRVVSQHEDLGTAIDRAIADVELLAARSVALGADDERWRLDRFVSRLGDDIRALELAHRDLTDAERSR